MKKLFIIFILLSSVAFSINAKPYTFEGVEYVVDLETFFCFKNGKFEIEDYSGPIEPVITSYTCEIKKEGAYLVANLSNTDSAQKMYIFNADSPHIILYNATTGKEIIGTELKGSRDEPWIYTVRVLGASSYLTETLKGKQVSYVPENVGSYPIIKSWVEGVDGFGKGEWISFLNCGNGSRKIYIINGFFSPEKPSLFYDNNRIKTLKINCYKEDKLVSTQFRELKDTGEMQLIEFTERYNSFEFIIEDVYPGKKYDDTAITGIFVDALDCYR